MKRKIIGIICIILIVGILMVVLTIGITGVIAWMFTEQYNTKGISHFLVITIDENQSKQYIGELDNHRIYIEKLNIEGTNFRTINAENMSIKDAIEKELVSIEDWKRYAWKIKNNGDTEILQYENYEIAVLNDECIIRPLTK